MDMKQSFETVISNYMHLLIVVFALIITLFIFYRQRKGKKSHILLTGLCDSGKTSLFSQLVYQKFVQTQTSIKENIGDYGVKNVTLKIVDIPGHKRLRDKFVEKYKDMTRGIVFVIDSLTIQQDVRDAAEFLYNVLVDPVVSKNKPYVAILCNKQDQTLSKGSNVIKSILEKELNTLRKTKSSQLDSVDPKAKKIAGLGSADTDFSFTSLDYNIEFMQCFAYSKNGSVNIDDLKAWLGNIA